MRLLVESGMYGPCPNLVFLLQDAELLKAVESRQHCSLNDDGADPASVTREDPLAVLQFLVSAFLQRPLRRWSGSGWLDDKEVRQCCGQIKGKEIQ